MIERLRKEMARQGMNARELSSRASLGPSFVYDLLSGKSSNPTTKKLSSIAEALGVGLPYLVSGSNNDNITYGKDENFIAIPMVLNSEPKEKKAHVYKQFLFHKEMLTENIGVKTEDLKIISITENYLHPNLQRKDTVLVDTSCKTPTRPGIFIIMSGNSMVARHIEYTPDKNHSEIFVGKDASNIAPYTCNINDIEIIGRVVWLARAV